MKTSRSLHLAIAFRRLAVVAQPDAETKARAGFGDLGRYLGQLGAPADERNAALEGLRAPDFTLPDIDGKPRRLSELRGKKVFLATWASW